MNATFSPAPGPSSHRLACLVHGSLAVIFALFALALFSPALRPHRALADLAWCWDDPIVTINGITVSTQIGALGSPAVVQRGVQKATIVYTLPSGVSASVISTTNTYFHEKVVFVNSNAAWTPGQPVPVGVTVSFVANSSFQTQMINTLASGASSTTFGTTDTGMSSSFSVQ
jgi:hypothetical protein